VLTEVECGDTSRKADSSGLLSAQGGEPDTRILRVPVRLRVRWSVSSLRVAGSIASSLDLVRGGEGAGAVGSRQV
jgi:hypothetical protein